MSDSADRQIQELQETIERLRHRVVELEAEEERRRSTQIRLQERLQYEGGLTNAFHALLADNPGAVDSALSHLLQASDADRVYIFENFSDPLGNLCMRQTHEVCADGVTRQLGNPALQRVPYADGFERWCERLSGGHWVAGHLRELPEGEQEVLALQDIQSILVIPIHAGDQWLGFIGFDVTREEREWRDQDILLLTAFSDMVGVYMERSRFSSELAESEARYRSLVEQSPDGITVGDEDGRVVDWSHGAESITGVPKEEVLGMYVWDVLYFLSPESERGSEAYQRSKGALTGMLRGDEGVAPQLGAEQVIVRPDGERRVLQTVGFPVAAGDRRLVVSIYRDVTRRRAAEDRLAQSLQEKELLIQETHHRIKNNLTMIESLINIQARTGVPELEELTKRIHTITAVHEQLYRSPDLARVNLRDYLSELVQNLFRSMGPDDGRVCLRVDIASAMVSMDDAVPLGLIVTELMTNSLKYAFPAEREGILSVHAAESENCLVLVVEDDGVGLPEGVDPTQSHSLGLRLVVSLVRQLGASLDVSSNDPTQFAVTLPLR
jgi:PAS domain S-box-containing protein